MIKFLLGVPQEETAVMENEEEVLYYEVPEYMDIAPCEMFKEEIKARREYAQFVNTEMPELEQHLNSFIQKYSTQNSVGWIGGSRAWKRVYEQTFSQEPLDLLTESAILSAGNYDIFMIFNNKDSMVRSFGTIKEEITKLVNTIKLKLVESYTVEIKYVKGQTMKVEDKLEMCALFPCKSIAVEITSNIDSNSRRKKQIKTNNSNSVILQASSSSSSSASSSCNSIILEKPKVNEKLLLYIEISYMRDVNINLFRTEFLNDNYLNPKGLFLFSQFLKNPRTDKGINVDVLRENFIRSVISKEVSVASLSYQTAEKYNEIFGTRYSFHVKFLNYLYMKAVYKLHEEQQQYNIEQIYTFYVMETLRPMINTCVSMLSNILKHSNQEYKNAFLLIVGGDAMRRYKYDITNTSDIDTKLYYDKTMTVTKRNNLINMILAFMSLFTVLLNNTYKLDQTNTYTLESKSKADYTVYLPKLRLFDDAEALDYMRDKKSITINNFRLRYIEASYEFPVNLFSIDFNVPVIINIFNRKQQFRSHLNIPVFDLVLQEIENTDSANVMIHNSSNAIVPVASLQFLKEDIRTTYSNVYKTKMRFNNDKVQKDDYRLDELEQLEESNYNKKLDVLFNEKYLILDNKNDIRLHIKYQTTEYLKKMKGVIAKNRRKHVLKHKLPFRKSKIDDIEASVATYDFENNIYKKMNMTTFSHSNTIHGGKMNGEKIMNYIKMRDSKLYKLIKFRKIKLENSLPLDKYILEYLYN